MSEDPGFINKNKPQIKAPRVTPLEGVSTYAPQGIRVRGVEGTQSCASGGRVHVCPARAYVLFGSREPLGFGLENPQGFGIDERRYGLDLFGSLGQGMLATEALRDAPGLTLLGLDLDIHESNLNRRNGILGLSPLHLDNEPEKSPQRTLRTQSPNLANLAVFAPFAVRVTKEREMSDR